MTTYENTEHGFSIEYPAVWAQQSHGAATSFQFQFNEPEGSLSAGVSVDYRAEIVDATHVTAATAPGLPSALAIVLSIFFTLNLVLFTFNLIPFPPLDGSGALPLLLPRHSLDRYFELFWQPAYLPSTRCIPIA